MSSPVNFLEIFYKISKVEIGYTLNCYNYVNILPENNITSYANREFEGRNFGKTISYDVRLYYANNNNLN